MTKPKSKSLGPLGPHALAWWGGELVATMPDLAEALHDTGIDAPAFADWLRQPLELYRFQQQARAQMAQPAAVLKWLQVAADDLDAALADGRLHRLPAWFAAPAVWFAAHKMGLEWRVLLRSGDRPAIARCLATAIASLRRERSRRGRPAEKSRDALLSLVVEHLKAAGLTPEDAQNHAGLVLSACGVPKPEDSIARAARRGRGAISV